jgi:4-hydroxybenzoate polyprenyltransferase
MCPEAHVNGTCTPMIAPAKTPNSARFVLQSQRVLCVDLDGTLLASDVLWESLILLFKTQPLKLFLLPLWLWHGKAYLKQQIARHVVPNPTTLPYREEVLDFLRREKAQGRDIVLACGSDQRVAKAVGQHIGLFSTIIASDGITNLVGKQKLKALQNYANVNGFDYVGNGKVDLSLWKAATKAIVVHPSGALLRKVQSQGIAHRIFFGPNTRLTSVADALRVHQWVKNVLLFVPLLLDHQIFDLERLGSLLYAFLSFSVCASSVYIVNDLLDLESDRQHPKKKRRPFAAGTLPISMALILIPVLLAVGFLIAIFLLPLLFAAALTLYLVLSTAYSLYLKRLVLVDVLVLAALYTIRVLSGAIAVSGHVSPWLLAFCIFLFFSLALIKRYSEVNLLQDSGEVVVNGRGYQFKDRDFLLNVGIASGYLSLLVFALYINSQEVIPLYQNPEYLWLACPLFLYWITRIWLLAYRGSSIEDPLVSIFKDPASYVVGAVIGFVILIAI